MIAVASTVGLLTASGAAAALPDGRGFEVVSPSDKNGGDVMTATVHTRAAADGGAVAFMSLTGFGDVHGSSIASEYVSERTGAAGTSGWVTHGITPPQPPQTLINAFFGLDPNYEGEMSADLTHGVFRAGRPIADAPNVADIANLYVRADLRTPGTGTYQLATDAAFPISPSPFDKPFVAGASDDFSHVIFESTLDLTPDASGSDPKLYEWATGTLRLAGILPDGTPAAQSQAGMGASQKRFTPRAISSDGSRIFFQSPLDDSGNAYMRVNGTSTVQLNASEKTTPETPQGATVWTASADGTRSFLITREGLVNGDDDDAPDLYMYDATAAAGHHLTLLSPDGQRADVDAVLGVVGASADGHTVYFVAAGQLKAGEPVLDSDRGLYRWHDGSIDYIGSFANVGDASVNTLDVTWVVNTDNARVTPDGRHLLFMTTSDAGFRGREGFAGYDHGSTCTMDTTNGGPCHELYVYSADSGRLRCASCNPTGAAATADAVTSVFANSADSSTTSHLSRALSDDGRWVFFSTKEALVPEDTNRRWDAYEYDVATGRPHLLSSGTSTDDSYFMEASPSGRDAFFATRQRLVGWDVDDSYDLYDARVGGGLPDPVTPLPPCAADGCQSQGNVAPAAGTVASDTRAGAGNAAGRLHRAKHKHAKRCTRGKRRVVVRHRARCVAKRSANGRKAGSGRAAGGARR